MMKKNFKNTVIAIIFLGIVISLVFFTNIFQTKEVDANLKLNKTTIWKDGSWGYAKKITIDHSKVSGTLNLNNFPLLVSLTDANLKHTDHGGYVGKTDGTDIFFVGENGVKLDHEIEKYASTTGELIAWVRLPVLYPENATNLLMYFGNSGASDQQNITGVWDSSYKAVYHLGDGLTLNTNDSSLSGYNLTNTNATATSSAKIYGGAYFDSTDYIQGSAANTRVGGTTNATWQLWFYSKSSGSGNLPTALSFGTWSNGNVMYRIFWSQNYDTENNRYIRFETKKSYTSTTKIATTKFPLYEWANITITYDNQDVGNELKFYQNGSLINSFSLATSSFPTELATMLVIGNGRSNTTVERWDGSIDEVRVSDIARSADWVATEYNNQSSTSTFYTVSSLLTPSNIDTASAPASTKVKVRGGVKFR